MRHKLLHPSATFLKKTEGSAGYDLTVTKIIDNGDLLEIYYGVTVTIPKNCVGLLVPRSSTYERFSIMQVNGVGIIDSDYRGELIGKFVRVGRSFINTPKVGDCIGQLVIARTDHYRASTVPKSTNQRTGGFGSTDKQNTKTL